MRESTAWDSNLRRLWATALFVIVAAAVLTTISWWILTEQHADVVFLSVVAPLAPAFIWSLREGLEQFSSSLDYEELRSRLRSVWDSALAERQNTSHLARVASDFASAFLAYRSGSSPVPHWIYAINRSISATVAQDTAASLIREFGVDSRAERSQ